MACFSAKEGARVPKFCKKGMMALLWLGLEFRV